MVTVTEFLLSSKLLDGVSYMMKRTVPAIFLCLVAGLILNAGENTSPDMNWKIRQEETDNSQVMHFVHYLTDVYGPRLTGSPNYRAACQWAIDQMKTWGMQNEHLEEWDFGHPGWACEKYFVYVVSPYRDHLSAKVEAWTPSTRGTVRARVVQILPPERPLQEKFTEFLDSVRDKVRGRIVLVGEHISVPVTFNPSIRRLEDSEVRAQFDPKNPTPPMPRREPEQPKNGPKPLTTREMDEQINAMLLAGGALVKVTDAARDHGQIRAFANRTYDPSKTVPSIVIRNEDYGRMTRVLADGTSVEMEVEILTHTYSEGKTAYNAIAEIPGADKKDEVVMLGGHIDSWHAGEGATDNATGAAAMMEAARVLQKLGVKPRRTIRVALWGGEEQGLLGSKAYVKEHFGTFESPKPEFSRLMAYLNLDAGTGRVRGATIFGPPEAATILRQILEPFQDLSVLGAISSRSRSHGNTDSSSFDWAGLAGVNLSQDPIEYFTHSWHTDLDTYERAVEGDLKQCAIVVAAAVYHLAMRDDMLPRFTKENMPEPPK